MMFAKVLWLVIITLITMWNSVVASEPIVRFLSRSADPPLVKPVRAIRSWLVPIVVVAAVVLAVFSGIEVAILAVSLLSLTLGVFDYCCAYRFASRGQKLFDTGVRLIALTKWLSFFSSVLCLVLLFRWFLFPVPIVLWFVVGFLSAEMAIRQHIRKSKLRGNDCDRQRAIFAINDNQGRSNIGLTPNRYPFP